MTEKGYIYVLANSSMPGIVKIGKTTSHPEARAQELSNVTGVPTPFIVVYSQLFEDCHFTENYIHTLLAKKGYRYTENREFFSAPVNEVVNALVNAPGVLKIEAKEEPDDLLKDSSINQNDELSELQLSNSTSTSNSFPWSNILEEAENYYYGLGEYIQDYGQALKLYKEAAKLGSKAAYYKIGDIYKDGEGVREDINKALEYYKIGVQKGNYFCYMKMAELFALDDNKNNFEKCINLFFKERENNYDEELEKYINYFKNEAFYMISKAVYKGFSEEYFKVFLPFKEDIIKVGEKTREFFIKKNTNTDNVEKTLQLLSSL